jgi:sugar-specific transcriptional regulator TrmB
MRLAILKMDGIIESQSKRTRVFSLLQFEQYLIAQKKRNVRQIMSYTQRYHNILYTGDASSLVNLKSGAIRRHCMEALTELSKYLGEYDTWCSIRKRYQLHWTDGDESLKAMARFFNTSNSLENMIQTTRQMVETLPPSMAQIVKLGIVTGLRSAEIIQSARLINNKDTFVKYYDSKQMTLCHFKFPEHFVRTTKKAFLSFVTPKC